jgi:hypothetical protein
MPHLQEFERMVRRGIKTFLVYPSIQPAAQRLCLHQATPKIERAVLSLLGDAPRNRGAHPSFLF